MERIVTPNTNKALSENERKVINNLSDYIDIEPRINETQRNFLKRVLFTAAKSLSGLSMSEISGTSPRYCYNLCKKYGVRLADSNEYYRKYEKFRLANQRLMQKIYASKNRPDSDIVRQLIYKHKSIQQTADELGVKHKTIQNIVCYHRKKNPSWLTYTCYFCEKKFSPINVTQKYCSYKCRCKYGNYIARVERKGLELKHYGDEITCKICGEKLGTIQSRHDFKKKYCDKCLIGHRREKDRQSYQKKHNSQRVGDLITCPNCHKEFVKINSTHKYCSPKCRRQSKRKRRHGGSRNG